MQRERYLLNWDEEEFVLKEQQVKEEAEAFKGKVKVKQQQVIEGAEKSIDKA